MHGKADQKYFLDRLLFWGKIRANEITDFPPRSTMLYFPKTPGR
jgi:hypothetical protein